MRNTQYKYVGDLAELISTHPVVVNVDGHTLALFFVDDQVYAVDNRCPHMGFPLHQGTVQDGILTCHWHHARFDLASGGTFDQWADDVPNFPIEVRDGEIWVDLTPMKDPASYQNKRLQDGLERNLSLVIGKSVINLLTVRADPLVPFLLGLEFGVTYRQSGWGQGLTMHTCMMNLLPFLTKEDQDRALVHGLTAVARDTFQSAPRFQIDPLPSTPDDLETLKRWFRQFIEVRDAEGAERCLLTAIQAGADDRQIADMLYAAATDHRYIQIGHPLDFTNKAFEALDHVGWSHAPQVLPSLVTGYATANRMEESNAWRYPIDLVTLLETTFDRLPSVVQRGSGETNNAPQADHMFPILLGENPHDIVDNLISALEGGWSYVDLAGLVAHAAALRIARFHPTNEFSDWDTALHTFTFANAVHQGLKRTPPTNKEGSYPLLLRGVFDAAMSIYLDRFLNVPAAKIPNPEPNQDSPEKLLGMLTDLLNRQQQVDQSAELVAQYLMNNGDPKDLLASMGGLLLREDRDFHTIQAMEAAYRQFADLRGLPSAKHFLIAAVRYLAAHAPTVRSQEQTFSIAQRLSRGENLFEE
jgi:nitrite reductase/ring-hydroxylating ferredoxin subunit